MIRRIALLLLLSIMCCAALADDSPPPRDASQPLLGRWRDIEVNHIVDFYADGTTRGYMTSDAGMARSETMVAQWKWLSPGALKVSYDLPDGEMFSTVAHLTFLDDDRLDIHLGKNDEEPSRLRRFDQPLPPGYGAATSDP